MENISKCIDFVTNTLLPFLADVSSEICQQGAERNDENCEDSRYRCM